MAGPSFLAPFEAVGGELCCGGVALAGLAERFGTPLYVYSAEGIGSRYRAFRDAFAAFRPEIHFAVKSCGNLRVLRLLVGMGAGLDVVSGGELERAWLAGCPMSRVAFAGVGKTEAEIRAAIDGSASPLRGSELAARMGAGDPADRGAVGLFNIESVEEYARVDRIARAFGCSVRVAIRVNPDVDARTHPYTTTGRRRNKFGIEIAEAEDRYAEWAGRAGDGRGARPVGLHVHIGSPVYEAEPFVEAARVIAGMADRLRGAGIEVGVLDMGGGWPSAYHPDQVRDLVDFASALSPVLTAQIERGARIHLEPGRSVVANAGVLLTRVQYVKRTLDRRFIMADAGMQTLLRPALYGAEHAVWPVRCSGGPFDSRVTCDTSPADIVGPVCETGDFLARDRAMPPVEQDDLLAVFGAGAYGMSMSSTYNDHPRPAEVLISGGEAELIRRRETVADLVAHEAGL